MVKIGSKSLQKAEFSNPDKHIPVKENVAIESPEARTLKAVYPHFAKNSKRESIETSMNFTTGNLSQIGVESAIENGEEGNRAMRDVHSQIHKIYKGRKLSN